MKKLMLLMIVLVSFAVFAAPKAEAGVFIGIGLPVFPVYPVYPVYPAYYGPYPVYYAHPYAYGYPGYYRYGHIYNGRLTERHGSRTTRDYHGDK